MQPRRRLEKRVTGSRLEVWLVLILIIQMMCGLYVVITLTEILTVLETIQAQ